MCDRNIPRKFKYKVYKTVIKPDLVYGAECWEIRKEEERKLHTTEMRMLRWARGKTRLDHARNVDIWKEAHMYPMAEFFREEIEMVWTCAKARQRRGHEKDITDDIRWKAKSKQTKAEMATPGGYGKKPDDDWDGRRQKTLACHDSSRHTTMCRGGKVRRWEFSTPSWMKMWIWRNHYSTRNKFSQILAPTLSCVW